MTLAFALRGSNGLVIGADSRVSGPKGTSDTSTKFLQVNREVGVLTYGLADVGYTAINRLVDEVNKYGNFSIDEKRIVHFSEIEKKAEEIFKDVYESKLKEIEEENKKAKEKGLPEVSLDDINLITGFILGGYDANETNQFKIVHWNSPDFTPERRSDIIAAQWHISQFLSNHFYYSEMDVEQLKRLAVFMLIETETISPSVGGRLKLATVTLEEGFQQLNEFQIQKIIRENQIKFAKYRRVLIDNLRST